MIPMNIRTIALLIIGTASLSMNACSSARVPSCIEISPPDINMTGGKTVIERQIVGDYMELEKDAWIVSSIRTNVMKSKSAALTAGDEVLFKAMKIREFHFEKIRKQKANGAVGETNSGYIVYRAVKKIESNKEKKAQLLRMIDEENKARKTIFRRALVRSGIAKPDEGMINEFGRLFADEQRALARRNDWVQEKNGEWKQKK